MQIDAVRKWVIGGVLALLAFDLYDNSSLAYRPKKEPVVHNYEIGKDVDVAITLVSTDSKTLSCAAAEEIAGHHCEFESRTDRWSKPSSSGRPPALDMLAPYKTTDDQLLLVAGLFSEQALRARLAIDPPNIGQDHIRFVANCKLHVEAHLDQIDVRWAIQAPWQTQSNAWVGTVSGCSITDG